MAFHSLCLTLHQNEGSYYYYAAYNMLHAYLTHYIHVDYLIECLETNKPTFVS